jgi:hypothetical protein
MKLNNKQSCAIIRYLITNNLFGDLNTTWPISDALPTLGELFDGEIKEARIIYRFGMAGKIWNSGDRIYITGRNETELGQIHFGLAERERVEIQSANNNIAAIIEDYKD